MATNLRVLAFAILLASAVPAQQWNFTDAGGVVTLGTDLALAGATVASPSGTIAVSCPVTALPPGTYQDEWVCTGGAISIQSNDGLTVVNANLTSGTFIETASGGGRDHPTTYYYVFSGSFSGTLTQSGQAQAINGSTVQSLAGSTSQLGTGTIYSGATYVNTDYEPLYIAETYNNRIVRMDDMTGDNWIALGSRGGGTNQFRNPWGIAVDAAGKIYVTDNVNCRVVRMDDMSGTNWTSLGHCGSGGHQFNNPTGLFVDSAGKIYVADTGNNRVVRVNDIAGDGWKAYGAAGSGTGQFAAPEGIAVNSAGKIYIADMNNFRLVRMDNMAGTNWTTFGSSGTGTNQFSSPLAVSLDSTGRIYVADMLENRIVRFDDMLGTNWTVLGGTFGAGVNQFINPYGVFVDPYGTIFVADTHDNRIVLSDDMFAGAWTPFGVGRLSAGPFNLPTSVVAVPATTPTPVATLSAASLSFGLAVVGTATASQTVTLANIGAAPLVISSIVASADFSQTKTCLDTLAVGQSCTVSVAFAPAPRERGPIARIQLRFVGEDCESDRHRKAGGGVSHGAEFRGRVCKRQQQIPDGHCFKSRRFRGWNRQRYSQGGAGVPYDQQVSGDTGGGRELYRQGNVHNDGLPDVQRASDCDGRFRDGAEGRYHRDRHQLRRSPASALYTGLPAVLYPLSHDLRVTRPQHQTVLVPPTGLHQVSVWWEFPALLRHGGLPRRLSDRCRFVPATRLARARGRPADPAR